MESGKTISGKTYSEWIIQETKLKKESLWGVEVEFEPALCSTILGDGQQLVYVGSTDQRPYYWLVRIDSCTDIEHDDFNYEELIYAVEDDFGRHPGFLISKKEFKTMKKSEDWKVESFEAFEEYKSACKYPHLWWGMGGHWGLVVNFATGEIGN